MKLSEETLAVLKNFSAINNGIFFEQGKTIKTVSPQKSILVDAKVEEEVPTDFGIYDLNKFLGAHSLFENPEIEFQDKYLTFSGGNSQVSYSYCDASLVVRPPNKEVALPTVDVTFKMPKTVYDSVVKAAMVLQVPEIAVIGDGTKLKLVASESKNTMSDKFSYDVGETNKTFSMIFKVENFSKLMSKDYTVSISSKGLSKFESDDDKLIYHVAIEPNSNFEG
jgi:hypothetical protein